MKPSDGRPLAAAAEDAPSGTHSWQGALLFMLGIVLFAGMDNTTKYLVGHFDVLAVVAIRYLINCVLLVAMLAPSQGRALFRTQRTTLVVIRGACLAGTSLVVGFALQRMPVAETTAIVFLSPMLVVLLAGPLLGERIGALGWIGMLAGFGGILLIAHPGGSLDPVGTVLALSAAGLTAAYQLLSRLLASTEQTGPLSFYTALVGALAFGVLLPWTAQGLSVTPAQALLFVAYGLMGGLGHFLFTAAHRQAPTSVLAPMMYTQLIWAGLLGWLIFGHVPTTMSVVGMCIIAASGMLMALKSRMTRRAMAEPAE